MGIGSKTSVDNSTRISTVDNAFNVTASLTQGYSDIGSVSLDLPTQSKVQQIMPLLILTAGIVGLVLLQKKRG